MHIWSRAFNTPGTFYGLEKSVIPEESRLSASISFTIQKSIRTLQTWLISVRAFRAYKYVYHINES